MDIMRRRYQFAGTDDYMVTVRMVGDNVEYQTSKFVTDYVSPESIIEQIENGELIDITR